MINIVLYNIVLYITWRVFQLAKIFDLFLNVNSVFFFKQQLHCDAREWIKFWRISVALHANTCRLGDYITCLITQAGFSAARIGQSALLYYYGCYNPHVDWRIPCLSHQSEHQSNLNGLASRWSWSMMIHCNFDLHTSAFMPRLII